MGEYQMKGWVKPTFQCSLKNHTEREKIMRLVTAGQKLFEKFLMLARNDETSLGVMIARDDANNPMLCIGLREEDGNFTPLAILLTARQLSDMQPDWKASVAIQDLFDKGLEADKDKGRVAADFGKKSNPLFSHEAIAALELD